MRTIAMINQKGGVGKTTTVANLGAALADRGRNVALIDMDPQSHLTMHFGVEPSSELPGIYDMLTEQAKFSDVSIELRENLSVVPANIDLAGAEVELVSTVGREQLLYDRLIEEPLGYDYVVIDCPPSLGLLTLNALAAADEVVIPLQPHFLALQGLGKLLETVSLVRRRINPRLRVSGILLCMYESATRLAAEVTDDVAGFLATHGDPDAPWAGAKLFDTRIRRNIKLAECPSFGESIFHYAPASHGATDYDALAEEFLVMHEAPQEAVPVAEQIPPGLEEAASPDVTLAPATTAETPQPQPQPQPQPLAVAPAPADAVTPQHVPPARQTDEAAPLPAETRPVESVEQPITPPAEPEPGRQEPTV